MEDLQKRIDELEKKTDRLQIQTNISGALIGLLIAVVLFLIF